MKTIFTCLKFLIPVTAILLSASSCEVVEDILPKTETEKRIEIFTRGGEWRVDSLIGKTDVLSGGVSTITSDSLWLNHGTITFQEPNQTVPGYGSGFMIHRFVKNDQNRTDTAAWVPYNFDSGNENYITLFFALPGDDLILDGYKMILDPEVIEDGKIVISGWRRETIPNGSGGSYGSYRKYYLTR